MMEEKSFAESRIRALTKLYYSRPDIQKALFDFATNREVVPRYFEGFGKRPDMISYPSDIMGLVYKGATSFHCSEELWSDPLKISSDMSPEELGDLRSSWDLLIDIDSPYLDYSKIAALLVIELLEKHGIQHYGIKFSGNKGFHIIVPSEAFPKEHIGKEMRTKFPEWPRAITEYIMSAIRPKYNQGIAALGIDFKALEKRTNLKKSELMETPCPNCGNPAEKGSIIVLKCSSCNTIVERKDFKPTNRKLKCITPTCTGYFEVAEEKSYFRCPKCQLESRSNQYESSNKVTYAKSSQSFSGTFVESFAGDKLGSLDLVLVSPRHLFRMPYSLHEKTSLASVVIAKDELRNFSPKHADPLTAVARPFFIKPQVPGEARMLLESALAWKQSVEPKEEERTYRTAEAITGATEDMFPKPIVKLLQGLKEGRKRGLFILITFLRALNFEPDYINHKIREWNNLNVPPLKEGYVKGQIDWHLRQKKIILPPNYSNPSFYKDLNLLDKQPTVKNPIVEVLHELRKSKRQ